MNKAVCEKGKSEKIWSIIDEKLGMDYSSILNSIAFHLEYTQGKERYTATDCDFARSICYAIRDRLMEKWNTTQTTYYKENVKKVYYLSLEYLMGRALKNSLINMGIYDECKKIFDDIGFDLEVLEEYESDAGLGNGGLGRLAACFLDSMATMEVPAFGYGIRYDYGIFTQIIVDGFQMEKPDFWLDAGKPWEILRFEHVFEVHFYGRVKSYLNKDGILVNEWVDTEVIRAVPYDYAIPGYLNNTSNTLRLWSARASKEFDLDYFNSGNYMQAVEDKVSTENITRVLYPRDDAFRGKELRLKQEYFFVSATLQDIIRRHMVVNDSLDNLPDKATIQMNDTHPAIAIPEMMRILIDNYNFSWEKAWDMTTKLFAYTNHTVMPEALERWPVDLLGNLLPRHLQIIYEINSRFLEEVKKKYPLDGWRLKKMSIIEENPVKSVRMANLAIVGSHSVNGVAALHSKILKEELFKEFNEFYPGKFNNKTNGITQRRWLKLCNPLLSELITNYIGDKWVTNLYELKKLVPLANNKEFQKKWIEVKRKNKIQLAKYIEEHNNIKINPDSIFDCQVKRIHEYKRQLMNILHVIYLHNFYKDNPNKKFVPKTFIFGGKAAPGYAMAKLIIKLINSVADVINNDPELNDKLKVVFIENYNVSIAEMIFPAADLSEQISTAGLEASGTGNMKFALNGALTIGTLDGANIEIMEEVGESNIFIFGLKAQEVQALKSFGYNPRDEYFANEDLKKCIDQISTGYFSNGDNTLFAPLVSSLLNYDVYLVMKDFEAYKKAHMLVGETFQNKEKWTQMSILNSANMGKFSSDRTIDEYSKDIWNVNKVHIKQGKKTKNKK